MVATTHRLKGLLPKTRAYIILGIFYASTTIGPALGFTLGGQLLRVYVDFFTISADQ